MSTMTRLRTRVKPARRPAVALVAPVVLRRDAIDEVTAVVMLEDAEWHQRPERAGRYLVELEVEGRVVESKGFDSIEAADLFRRLCLGEYPVDHQAGVIDPTGPLATSDPSEAWVDPSEPAPAESWPAWTDDRIELGPPEFSPSADDLAWWREHCPAAEQKRQPRRVRLNPHGRRTHPDPITAEDVIVATGCC